MADYNRRRERHTAYMKRRRDLCRTQGMCVRCMRRKVKTGRRCTVCKAMYRDRNNEHLMNMLKKNRPHFGSAVERQQALSERMQIYDRQRRLARRIKADCAHQAELLKLRRVAATTMRSGFIALSLLGHRIHGGR